MFAWDLGQYSCNLTGHVTRKSLDSYVVLKKICCEENRGGEGWTSYGIPYSLLVQYI